MLKSSFFSQNQRKTIAAALTLASVVAIFMLLVLSLVIIAETVQALEKVLWPIAIASILGVLLQPLIVFTKKHSKVSEGTAVCVLYVLVAICLGVLSFLLLPRLIQESIDFVVSMPEIAQNLWHLLRDQYPEVVSMIQAKIGKDTLAEYTQGGAEILKNASVSALPALNSIKGSAANLFSWTAALAVVPIYLYYLLTFKKSPLEQLEAEVASTKISWAKSLLFLFREFSNILVAFFRGQLLVSLSMGVLFAVGFSLIGLKFGLALGLAFGLLNIIPYLGTILGLATTIPVAYFQDKGSLNLVVMALGTFLLVQLIEGYVLTPKIMKEKTGLHPMAIILSIFFWGTVFSGILGIVLAIPLTAFVVVLWHWAKREYLTA